MSRRPARTFGGPWTLWWLRTLAFYLRHAPDHRGRWRLLRHAVRLSPLLKAASGSRVVRVRDGFRLRVDGSSQSGRIVYVTGDYERDSAHLMRHVLRRGDRMVDVGANIGYFTVAAALAVGPEGRIVAFEPAPGTRRLLEANLRLNDLRNVTVRSEALAATSGDAPLYLGPQEDTGLASLRALGGSAATTVRQVRFDDLWQPEERVALVKIDVEGAELGALAGMEGLLERDRPDLIVEVTDRYLRDLGASAAQLFEFLAARGYRGFQIDHEASLKPIRGTADLTACPVQFNAFFTVKPPPSLSPIG